MDQVRNFLRVLRRIHFWLICGLVTLLSLVFWFLAVSDLNKTKRARIAEVEGQFNEANKISSEANIPNAAIAEKMDSLIALRQNEILEAWQVKYDQQNSEATGILTWPEELGRSFFNKVTPLRPIEKEVVFPMRVEDQVLHVGEREAYRDYLQRELPKLAESIGAEWMSDGSTMNQPRSSEFGNPGGVGGGETLSTQSIVEWEATNQQDLVATHFTFGGTESLAGPGRPMFESSPIPGGQEVVPSTLEILYAQEDLWVLRSLMKIIAETNGGAKSRFNAAIKRIEFIKIGKTAVRSAGKVTVAMTKEESEAANTSDSSGFSEGQGMGMESGMGRPPEGMGEGGMGERGMGESGMGEGGMGEGGMMSSVPDPANLRYVDANYQPLPAEDLRTVMKSTETLEAEKAYLAVAKRIPIRMRVSIDQRKIPQLLVQCANAELTVEVRQLRVNPTDDGSTSMFPGMPGRMGGAMGGGQMGSGRGESSWMSGSGTQPEVNLFPFDVTVEIYGIVYIYNPIDKRAMGIEEATPDEEELDPSKVSGRADPTTTGFAVNQ